MAKTEVDGRYQVSKMINGKRKYFHGYHQEAAIVNIDAYVESTIAQCANYDNTILRLRDGCEYGSDLRGYDFTKYPLLLPIYY